MAEVIDFNVSVNLAGISPVDVMMQDPPGGPHTVEILNVKQNTKEGEGGGKTSLHFDVMITEEGPGKGITTKVFIGTDWSKPFNAGHLKNLLLGMGANPEKVNGVVNLTPALFKGKKAYIFVKTPPEGEIDENTGRAARADKNFITPAQYEQAKRAVALNPNAAVRATPKPSPAAAAATNGSHAAPAVASTPTPVASAPAAGAPLADLFES